jgi:hypothetical protein
VANVRAGDSQTLRYLQGLRTHFNAQGADSVTAARKAFGALYGTVLQDAAMLAFVETFWVMGVLFLLMIPFLPLLQYAERVPCQEAAANAVAALFLSNTPEPWPDVLERDAQVEDGDLVPQRLNPLKPLSPRAKPCL